VNRALLAALALALALAGCRYDMVIESDPPGAEVYIDGIARGRTPLLVKEKPGWGRTAVISLRKPGYVPVHVEATESEIYHPTAAVIGSWYFVAPVVVWGIAGAPGPSRLKPFYWFSLEKCAPAPRVTASKSRTAAPPQP
jgi:hypothetical protein